MAKLLLRKDEVTLLKSSEAGKNFEIYGNLFDAMQAYTVLSSDEFEKNHLFNDKAKSVVLNNKKILFDEIKEEWSGIGYNDEATGDVHCQLCGTKNKLVFYIHNKLNDHELHVGSSCIKNFSGIENISQIRRSYNEQLKLNSERKRHIEFDEIDLEDINYIKNSEEWFHSFKVLLPYQLFNEIKTELFNLNSLKTTYIKSGGDATQVKQQYSIFKQNLETYKQKAMYYYNSNKNNILSCKKSLSDWLFDTHKDVWENIMKNNGFLDESTLKYCYQTNFVKSNLKRFNSRINDKGIQISGMNGSNIRFRIENSDYIYPLYFLIPNHIFMQNIGCYCLTSKKYSFGKIDFKKISIEQTNSNFEAMFNRIRNSLQKIGLGIEKSHYTNEKFYVRLPIVTASSRYSSRETHTELGYKKLSDASIFEIFNSLIFKNDNEIEIVFSGIFQKLNKTTWLSKEEKDRLDSISKSLTMQKQREFIPYS